MTMDQDWYEFARFTQEFRNRPQRRRLGVELGQLEAQAILGDEAALRREYDAWRSRTGRPTVDGAAEPVRRGWLARLLRRR